MVTLINCQSGDVALKEVVQLFRNETYELTTVKTNDVQGIISTPSHPYFTIEKSWILAKDLRAGDTLLYVNGKTVVVEWVQHEIFENPVTVYNFEVRDYHTYFVAESVNEDASKFVLVHNSCAHQTGEWTKIRRNFWKSEAKGKRAQMYEKMTPRNLERMTEGLAPIGRDGYSMVLHHTKGISNDINKFKVMMRNAHISWHKIHGYHI